MWGFDMYLDALFAGEKGSDFSVKTEILLAGF